MIKEEKHLKLVSQLLTSMGDMCRDLRDMCEKHLRVEVVESHKSEAKSSVMMKQNGTLQYGMKKVKQQQINQIKLVTNMPKHPVSSFFYFYQEQKQKIGQQFNENQGPKIAKLTAMRWKTLSQDDKIPYQKKAEEERIKYKLQIQKYKQQFPEQYEEIMQSKKVLNKTKFISKKGRKGNKVSDHE